MVGASFRTSKNTLSLTWRLYYGGAVITSITVAINCNIHFPRIPREIVPSGSKALVHTARLRNERQSEYRDYIKSHGSTKSIAERRREMALERDKELSSHSDSSLVRNRDVGMDYGSLKERRMAEERRYRHSDSSEHRRGKWEDSKPSVTFKQEQSDKVDHIIITGLES